MLPGLDITSAHELGHRGWSDPIQLAYVMEQDRIIITENRAVFADLARLAIEQGVEYAGILLLPGSMKNEHIGPIARAIVRFEREHRDGVPPFYFDYLRGDAP